MESLLNRYRNITVLLLVIFAQLVLLAVQVKNDQDVQLIRVWTVTAVTPVARMIEGMRGGGSGFVHNYILLHDANADNRRLQAEVDRLKLDNIFLKSELNRADRAKALEMFQQRTASKTLAATIVAVGAGSNSKVVFVDRGTGSGVQRGMAVVTPDGIVGKVIAAYPTASAVQLVTDVDFAAGVVSQKTQVHGTLKGQGTPMCKVDYVPPEVKLEAGEMLFTSGDDRIFPRGFPVGVVKAVHPAQPFQEVLLEPSGLQRGLEDVLILVQGVHQAIPQSAPTAQPVYIAPPPPNGSAAAEGQTVEAPPSGGTEADKLRAIYKSVGEAQKHTFGESLPGAKPPDFTKLPAIGAVPNSGGNAPATPSVVKPPAVKPFVNPAAPATKSPDAAGRGNQPAGAPPGGPPH